MTNLYFLICGFFCIVLILILFFSRERIATKETRLYGFMIVSSFFDIILVIAELLLCYWNYNQFLVEILNRIDFIYYILWPALLFLYVYYITYKDLKVYKNLKNFVIVNTIICTLIEFILPIEIINQDGTMGVSGLASNFVYIIALFYLIGIGVMLLRNIRKVFQKKYMPLLVFIALMSIAAIVRIIDPTLIIIPTILVYIDLIMYNTIENPDVKVIEQLNIAKDAAEKANRAKSEFLSSMSHEIRTPLNAIVGFSDCILNANDLESAKSDAKDIIMASQNLLEIVNGILDISKIEANKMEIIESEYHLRDNLESLAKLVLPRIGEKPIELKTKFAEDIPNTLYGDISKIKQIITNILTNAVKYTEKGVINFEVNCINNHDICSLIISVEDTGRGIKEEKINSIFNKFERLEEDRNTTLEGTGLGLAITKKLVEMLGGKIVVQSKYGEGSKFTVYLKQQIRNTNVVETIKTIPFQSMEDLSGKRVLIVDDNRINLKVATRMLSAFKVVVEECESGYECLDRIKAGKNYDLILMDDMMPKMTGTETLQELKKDSNFGIPVVVLTANAIEGMKEKYLNCGFTDYLSKPIDKSELERVLHQCLSNHSVEERREEIFEPLPKELFDINVPLKKDK